MSDKKNRNKITLENPLKPSSQVVYQNIASQPGGKSQA